MCAVFPNAVVLETTGRIQWENCPLWKQVPLQVNEYLLFGLTSLKNSIIRHTTLKDYRWLDGSTTREGFWDTERIRSVRHAKLVILQKPPHTILHFESSIRGKHSLIGSIWRRKTLFCTQSKLNAQFQIVLMSIDDIDQNCFPNWRHSLRLLIIAVFLSFSPWQISGKIIGGWAWLQTMQPATSLTPLVWREGFSHQTQPVGVVQLPLWSPSRFHLVLLV